jgi:hypothetical protein
MDRDEEFFEGSPIDRTPYAAFAWLVVISLVILIGGSYGLFRASSYVKSRRILRSLELPGGSSINTVQDAADAALRAAQDAATQKATDTANAAASAATQQLLNNAKASIQQGANDAVKQAATPTSSPSASATASGVDTYNKYLK